MKHLDVEVCVPAAEKILANWATLSSYLYDDSTPIDVLKKALKHEASHKNRYMIIDRLTTRLVNLMKVELRTEIQADIQEIQNGVGEKYSDLPKETD